MKFIPGKESTSSLTLSSSRMAEPELIIVTAGLDILSAFEACTFLARFRGLHAVWPLLKDQALIIRHCNSIHTFTMPCGIDCVFIDDNGMVLRADSIPPLRASRCASATSVVEMTLGTIDRFGILVGDVLTVKRKKGD